jgi:hypothetical protein
MVHCLLHPTMPTSRQWHLPRLAFNVSRLKREAKCEDIC